MAQKSGSDVMWFVYDSDGARVGFTYNGATYHYLTNAPGDVTGITDLTITLWWNTVMTLGASFSM
ncbi:MAG: hypothetical protein E7519_01690 [Ruminococcaceae bacterium]|nr:hypothetical protein [Oscillospiraceae bacterium]